MKNRFKVLRAERDWTQADLATRLDVSRQLSRINAVHYPLLQLSLGCD
jgi:DNA-binding Xre family transcriptional regulator